MSDSSMSEFQHLKLPLEYIKQATNNFDVSNFIAQGGFGAVYRGEFLQSDGRILKAAVKRLTPSNNQGDADFWREIMLLSDYKHENIVLLLGFCYQGGERILVYEYAPNKSLDVHLGDPKFTWIQRLKICLGAARGLEYLHNPRGGQQRVLHRDIKSANILLDENWIAKIADFGFSKYGPANQKHSMLISEPKGTLGYCDPVFLDTTFYKKESDVYSFGVVLLEVLCSRLCVDFSFKDMRRSLPVFVKNSSKEHIRDTIIDVNLLQQMEQDSFDTFITLAYQCLEREQKQRPSMELIVKKIETALEYQVLKSGEPENGDLVNKKRTVIIRGVLSVTVISAEDLPAVDLMGKADPFIVLTMKKTGMKNSTRVVSETLNPVWNQTFDFVVEDGLHDMLVVEVYDHDTFENDYIGRCILTLKRVILEGEYKECSQLDDAKSGKLHLNLKWMTS